MHPKTSNTDLRAFLEKFFDEYLPSKKVLVLVEPIINTSIILEILKNKNYNAIGLIFRSDNTDKEKLISSITLAKKYCADYYVLDIDELAYILKTKSIAISQNPAFNTQSIKIFLGNILASSINMKIVLPFSLSQLIIFGLPLIIDETALYPLASFLQAEIEKYTGTKEDFITKISIMGREYEFSYIDFILKQILANSKITHDVPRDLINLIVSRLKIYRKLVDAYGN